MEQIVLKSRVGTVRFTRRHIAEHPVTGKKFYDVREYAFTDQNDFRATVPKQVWEELADEYLDSNPKVMLRYREALIPQ